MDSNLHRHHLSITTSHLMLLLVVAAAASCVALRLTHDLLEFA